jgi:hypothetical protein
MHKKPSQSDEFELAEPPPAAEGDPGHPGLEPNDPPEDDLLVTETLEAGAAEAVKPRTKLEYALEKREDLNKWKKVYDEVVASKLSRQGLRWELVGRALRDERIPKRAVAVLWCVVDYVHNKGMFAWPRVEEIAKRLDIWKQHASADLILLAKYDYLVRTDGHKNGPRWGTDRKTGETGLFLSDHRGSVYTFGKAGFGSHAEMMATSSRGSRGSDDAPDDDQEEAADASDDVTEDGYFNEDGDDEPKSPETVTSKTSKSPPTVTSDPLEVTEDGYTRGSSVALNPKSTEDPGEKPSAVAKGEPLKEVTPEELDASARPSGRDCREEEGAAVVAAPVGDLLPQLQQGELALSDDEGDEDDGDDDAVRKRKSYVSVRDPEKPRAKRIKLTLSWLRDNLPGEPDDELLLGFAAAQAREWVEEPWHNAKGERQGLFRHMRAMIKFGRFAEFKATRANAAAAVAGGAHSAKPDAKWAQDNVHWLETGKLQIGEALRAELLNDGYTNSQIERAIIRSPQASALKGNRDPIAVVAAVRAAASYAKQSDDLEWRRRNTTPTARKRGLTELACDEWQHRRREMSEGEGQPWPTLEHL